MILRACEYRPGKNVDSGARQSSIRQKRLAGADHDCFVPGSSDRYPRDHPAAPEQLGAVTLDLRMTFDTCQSGDRKVEYAPWTPAVAKTVLAARGPIALELAGMVGPCDCWVHVNAQGAGTRGASHTKFPATDAGPSPSTPITTARAQPACSSNAPPPSRSMRPGSTSQRQKSRAGLR
jgi:hypothetical protein